MIPKKIHCCWLGGGNYPPKIQCCIESWRRVLPDYEIIVWNEERFDVRSVPWVRKALKHKKYAFAADYIRHYALYTEGGIYLDTDIEVRKPFDELLTASRLFTVIEVNEEVLAQNIADGLLDEAAHQTAARQSGTRHSIGGFRQRARAPLPAAMPRLVRRPPVPG